jgi:CheY-like chemotaxis protein/anti-sigma regulatory factor (Ser/Thr protein kinase)
VVLNLLSNAFKFTAEGEVSLEMALERRLEVDYLRVAVRDTGIGIPQDKQKLIFEAFQQADGTTSRKYGGTGLGLSISREIARLLHGELRVQSELGKGSTFTLAVPITGPTSVSLAPPPEPVTEMASIGAPVATLPEALDDRDTITAGDRVVLIVEDDPTFADILLRIVQSVGLKGVVSNAGAGTLAMARKLMPDAITLDLGLADIDGWVLFDLLRHDPKTAGIPIQVISGAENADMLASKGAAHALTKPVSHEQLVQLFEEVRESRARQHRSVLVADPDADRRLSIVEAIRDGVTAVTAIGRLPANSDASALAQYDAIVLGIGRLTRETAHELEEVGAQLGDAVNRLVVYAPSLEGRSTHRGAVLNEARWVEGFEQLQAALGDMLPHPENVEGTGQQLELADLAQAKVLIVDDDIRNIYSLTSVLEMHGMEVLHAERGREGIAILEQTDDIDIALIDIMMPEMDGYETIREIRRRPRLAELPIISVTAKAMKGDRQKCLEAGATDYIAKPVDLELLMALLRVLLARAREKRRAQSGLLAAK